ncbi:hypothetical protein CVT25_000492 [Psilocybe cyanescens]|uniref:Uncharacterized protein n=1 Tax=Psilocybe cyanescens TaxID=93625 RepID=A0A409XW99_PSICY|nr:hypothetical protein CVT25_000492 [Psilocybe cyanescens]
MVGAIDAWNGVLHRLGEHIEGQNRKVTERRKEHVELVAKVTKKIDEVNALHDEVAKRRTIPDQRVIGFMLYSEKIVALGEPRYFTENWPLIELLYALDRRLLETRYSLSSLIKQATGCQYLQPPARGPPSSAAPTASSHLPASTMTVMTAVASRTYCSLHRDRDLAYDKARGGFSGPGSSGAIILVVGMLTGAGAGAADEVADIAYITPYFPAGGSSSS